MVAAFPNKFIYARWYRLTKLLSPFSLIEMNIHHARCERCFHKLNYEILKFSESKCLFCWYCLYLNGINDVVMEKFSWLKSNFLVSYLKLSPNYLHTRVHNFIIKTFAANWNKFLLRNTFINPINSSGMNILNENLHKNLYAKKIKSY